MFALGDFRGRRRRQAGKIAGSTQPGENFVRLPQMGSSGRMV